MKKTIRTATTLGLSALAMAIAQTASAQGYQIDEMSARRLGDAFSGGTAEARDASTAYYNPAGLVRLKQSELAGGISVLTTTVKFSGQALTADPADTSGSGLGVAPVTGTAADTASHDLAPNLYFAMPLGEGRSLGAALNVPFASSTDYGDDSVVRYQSVRSELTGLRLTLSLAQELSPQLSVGGGLVVQQMQGKIVNAIDAASLCSVANAMSGGLAPTCGTAGSGVDGRVQFKGDSIAAGYTLGALYQFSDDTRAGFTWHSAIKHHLKGHADVTMPAGTDAITSNVDPFFTTHSEKARFDLTTPEAASASLFHRIDPRFSVQADVTWTRWSRFESLDIATDSGFTASQTQHWHNNWRLAAGAEFQASSALALRTGIAWDQTPVRTENRNISFPLQDFHAASAGLSYAFTPAFTLDAALQRTLAFKSVVHDGDVATQLSQADGESSSSTWSAALGFNWKR